MTLTSVPISAMPWCPMGTVPVKAACICFMSYLMRSLSLGLAPSALFFRNLPKGLTCTRGHASCSNALSLQPGMEVESKSQVVEGCLDLNRDLLISFSAAHGEALY